MDIPIDAPPKREIRKPDCPCFTDVDDEFTKRREKTLKEFAAAVVLNVVDEMNDYTVCQKAAPYALGMMLAALAQRVADGPTKRGAPVEPDHASKRLFGVSVMLEDICEHARDFLEVRSNELLQKMKK